MNYLQEHLIKTYLQENMNYFQEDMIMNCLQDETLTRRYIYYLQKYRKYLSVLKHDKKIKSKSSEIRPFI